MELSRNRFFYYITGFSLIILSFAIYYFSFLSPWGISIDGLRSLSQKEVEGYVQYYLKENPQKVSDTEIKNILEFHPRIQSVAVKIRFRKIYISIVEKNAGYLEHNRESISEVTADGQVLQEMVVEKNHLSEDFPIFYLTAENDNEISAIKRDIIRFWEATKISHAFLWQRLSEVVLKRDEMDNPEIVFFHSHLPVKITMLNKFDTLAFRKLWAVVYLMESENPSRKTNVRIYQDHGVME